MPFGNCEVTREGLSRLGSSFGYGVIGAWTADAPGCRNHPIGGCKLWIEAVILSYPVVWGGRSSQDPAPIALGIYPGACFFLQLLELACVRGALFTTELSWALSVWTGLVLEIRQWIEIRNSHPHSECRRRTSRHGGESTQFVSPHP